ncbi:hypothetical protein ACFIJ5_16410 [Haloimpatiens sp. FM7330]|uniref:hypothetical protein n=1 Tax=Haloimpatiens sp. FM7330 TaxID=3298610 RepID=UPI0036253F9E
MNDFINCLKNTKVINRHDIAILKKYIDNKFSQVDTKKRASILSSTINKAIDKYLDGINSNMVHDIKVQVLKSTILNGKQSMVLYDIFTCYVSQNKNLNNYSISELLKWLNIQLEVDIEENQLIDFLKSLQIFVEIKNHEEDNLNKKQNEFDYDKRYENEQTLSNEDVEKVQQDNYNIIDVDEKVHNDKYYLKEKQKDEYYLRETGKDIVLKQVKLNIRKIVLSCSISFCILGLVGFGVLNLNSSSVNNMNKAEDINKNIDQSRVGEKLKGKKINSNVPQYMKYRKVNQKKLRRFLNKRNSLLAQEPYFSAIINSAKDFNINPTILFAITGQEQNFVPVNTSKAKKIGNNPFNVFHSWQEYNTNINDSSEIAARTVFNICNDIPKGANPFKWINRKYAEDKNWWKGVQAFFQRINSQI